MRLAKLILFSLVLTSGCTPAVIKPPLTQMQLREMQSRTYSYKDSLTTMKAVINALQDDNFIIKNADKELGFIQATRELDVEDGGERFASTFFNGAQARWRKNAVTECSANLTQMGDTTKVRIIFQRKVLDNYGNILEINQIESLKYYQDFFAKVDKSLFIENQKL